MAKPGLGKSSRPRKAYDDARKGHRQVRKLQKNIADLATKILTGDHTRMKLYGSSLVRPVTIEDPASYNPVLQERDLLVARLEELIDEQPGDATVLLAEDATAKAYPHLARAFNIRAFNAYLSDKHKASTPESAPREEKTREHGAEIGDEQSITSSESSILEESAIERDRVSDGSHGPQASPPGPLGLPEATSPLTDLPDPPTLRSAKRERTESGDERESVKRARHIGEDAEEEISDRDTDSVEGILAQSAKAVEKESKQ